MTWYLMQADIMAGYTSDAEEEPRSANLKTNNALFGRSSSSSSSTNVNCRESWRYRFRHVKPFDHYIPEAAMAFVHINDL
jgi:hypothetical protein